MGDVKVKINKKGLDDLLKSSGVQDDLEKRVKRIADAAGEGFEAEVTVGQHRARGAVWTATNRAKRGEAKDRRLTRALDAGRG